MLGDNRFDDQDPDSPKSFALEGFTEAVVARRTADVQPAMERVRSAVAEGAWAAGFVAYEAASAFDDRMPLGGQTDVPLMWFGIYRSKQIRGLPERAAYRLGEWDSTAGGSYETWVERIQEHIRQGETYQVNATFPLKAGFSGEPAGLYADLIAAQPSSFGVYLDIGDQVIASASPELFFRTGQGDVTARPMKGTAPRAMTELLDGSAALALWRSEKDRAENLMIVDLMRNDLGRVSEYGSVRVQDLFRLERLPTVWQMTSTVQGQLREGLDWLDVLKTAFPCGSITGAPKVRTMELIQEIEGRPRGVYCGAIGVISPSTGGQQATFSVAIRTAVVNRARAEVTYGVGGGITIDSSPEAETREAYSKGLAITRPASVPSLVETLMLDPEKGPVRLGAHLDRMATSAARFGRVLDRSAVLRAIGDLPPDSWQRTLRITSERDGAWNIEVDRFVPNTQPIVLAVDEPTIPHEDSGHKTSNRGRFATALDCHPDASDVILINLAGEVVETTRANIALRLGDHWFTPPLSSGCLPGVLRAEEIESGTMQEQTLTLNDLLSSDELALISSLRGWQQAVLI